MALNQISTATNGSPADTKIYRRALKLAEAQTKRQAVGTPGYRILHNIVGTHSAYVNGEGGATLISLSGSAGPTEGHPWTTVETPSNRSFAWTSDVNQWSYGVGSMGTSTFSDPAPTNPSYTYPNSSTGKTYNFNGTTWMSSQNLQIGGSWTTSTITVDYWFYPTANNVQLISESNNPDVTSGYHYSMLEIDSSGYVHARFYNETYPTSAIVSSNTVELNKWNHIWFQETAVGAHNFTLNNIATTGNATYTRIRPDGAKYYIIGTSDVTALTTYGRFQGKIGRLTISDYAVASTWSDQQSKFRPIPPLLSLDAGDVTSYAPQHVVTVASLSNGGTALHIPKVFDANIGNQVSAGYPVVTQWGGYHSTVTSVTTGTGGFGEEWIISIQRDVSIGFSSGSNVTFGNDSVWTDTIGGMPFTLQNGVTYNNSNGGYLQFNPGNSQYAVSTSTLGTLSNWTIEAWHYYDGTNTPTGDCIFTETYGGGEINLTLGSTDGSPGDLQTAFYSGGWQATNSGYKLTTSTWHHVVGTYDGVALKLYVDGTLVNSTANAGPAGTTGNQGYRLMSRWDPGGYWGGRLGVVRVYNTATNQAYITNTYNSEKSRYGL